MCVLICLPCGFRTLQHIAKMTIILHASLYFIVLQNDATPAFQGLFLPVLSENWRSGKFPCLPFPSHPAFAPAQSRVLFEVGRGGVSASPRGIQDLPLLGPCLGSVPPSLLFSVQDSGWSSRSPGRSDGDFSSPDVGPGKHRDSCPSPAPACLTGRSSDLLGSPKEAAHESVC